jgi:hypothetical protein
MPKKKISFQTAKNFTNFTRKSHLELKKRKLCRVGASRLWPPGIPQLARLECRMCLKGIPVLRNKHETPRYGIQEGAIVIS